MSDNFKDWEFACKGTRCCGGVSPMRPELIDGLEELRAYVWEEMGRETILGINSGFRCITHNSRTPGASIKSQHPLGTAADVRTPPGLDDGRFAELAEKVPQFRNGGIGIYNGRIHVDVRGYRARWDSR